MGVLIENYSKAADYVKAPFRYPGGKFYALKHIIPFLDALQHDEYREPFVGGGSVFFAKRKAKHNWINDLESEIINVYQNFADPGAAESLALRFDGEIASRERHAQVASMKAISDLDRAFKTYYLNRTSYSGIIHKPAWGYKEGKSSPPSNWRKFIIGSTEKLMDVRITSSDFEEVINGKPKGSRVLMYLDPPYFHADQKRAYTKSFELEDHVRLSQSLRETEYNFCLSYDDCTEIRELYDWAYIHERSWLYNTANISGSERITGNELVITNYQVLPQQTLF